MVECPHCRYQQSIERWLIAGSGKWRCSNCGSLLRFDMRRRVLISFVFFGVLFLLLAPFVKERLSPVLARLVLSACLLLGVIVWWRLERFVVVEPPGVYCRKCGYNLAENVSGNCPECGTRISN